MESNNVPEKVAWVLVREGQVLVTRNHGRDLFYFPGGHREPGETDAQTLVREIDEELQTATPRTRWCTSAPMRPIKANQSAPPSG